MFSLIFLVSLTKTLLPSEKTAWLMVGAYAAQAIYQDPKVQETSANVLHLINLKIKQVSSGIETDMEKQSKESAS